MNSNKKTESIKDSKTSDKFADYCKIAEDKIKEQNEVEDIRSSPILTRYAIVNCERLNVRMSPNIKSDVLCVVESGTEMTIDTENSTDTWIKVLEPNGAGSSGYCMKEFVLLVEK